MKNLQDDREISAKHRRVKWLSRLSVIVGIMFYVFLAILLLLAIVYMLLSANGDGISVSRISLKALLVIGAAFCFMTYTALQVALLKEKHSWLNKDG